MGGMAIAADAGSIAGAAAAQSPVLRVIVENLFYPVTLDVLHQVQTHLNPERLPLPRFVEKNLKSRVHFLTF